MPRKRRVPDLLAPEATSSERGRSLHARVLVRAKDFVDFCEVPELGDVHNQEVLFVDERAMLRGSPRRVSQVAQHVVAMMEAAEAQGRTAHPALHLEHVAVRAGANAQIRLRVRHDGWLTQALCFDGANVTHVHEAGAEAADATLPLAVRAGSTLVLTLENTHAVELNAQLVTLFDVLEPPAV